MFSCGGSYKGTGMYKRVFDLCFGERVYFGRGVLVWATRFQSRCDNNWQWLKINHEVQNGCRMWYSNNSQMFRNIWDRDNVMMDEDVSVMLLALFIYLSIYLSTIFTAEENSNHYISKTENKYLTHLCPMPPFSIAWKH